MTLKTLDQLLKENIISQKTYDRVVLCKQYIERKYDLKSKKNAELNNFFSELSIYNLNKSMLNSIKHELFEKEIIKYRKSREKQSIKEYEPLSIIGRGALGEVFVCRKKDTNEIVAIKKIKKEILVEKNQVIHIINEQQFMSKVKSPWVVELKASFQDNDFLFLVMEYCPGGDLMNLLIAKDILSEKEAKFYMAELVLAIESIHNLDCIHRDIKPDNILIDADGHLKLSDFGLSKISEKIFEQNNNINNNSNIYTHNKYFSCVGTAFYVAPEVLKKTGYGKEIDWWSAGIIFYEMLVGYAPFCSKETSEVCYKVMNWKKYFEIPKEAKDKMSDEAQDLIYKMINNKNIRLGKNGAEEIKKHPFFGDIDWNNVHKMKAPFIPLLENEYDTKYFNTLKEIEPFYPNTIKIKKRKDIEYLGYDYKKENSDYNYNEKDVFDKIKKMILGRNKKENIEINKSAINNTIINKTQNSSKRYSFENIKNKSFLYNKSNKYLLRNDDRYNTIIINTKSYKDNKLNIIRLPKRKTKNNLNYRKINSSNKIFTKNNRSINNSVPGRNKSKNKRIVAQFNSNKTNKNNKRISPKNNYDFIYKLLNISKEKRIAKISSQRIDKQKTKKILDFNSINNYLSTKFINSPKLLSRNITKQNELKKNKQNNNIKIINIIQNKNYNNIVHHNTNNNNNGKNEKMIKSLKYVYSYTNEK